MLASQPCWKTSTVTPRAAARLSRKLGVALSGMRIERKTPSSRRHARMAMRTR
jgi:hypothetical protein